MSSSSGLTFKLHPLVIVNMSDHYTRVKAQQRGHPSRVVGCLLGVQSGRVVEIFNSFEMKYDDRGGADGAGPSSGDGAAMDGGDAEIELDRSFLATKMDQYKKVFPKYDVLGWYSTGADVRPADMPVHKALMDINESPIYLLLNPAMQPAGKDLPIAIFESELHVIDGTPSLIFVSSTYTIETVEAERISVDHVAHIKPMDGSSAATHLAAHLTGMHSAIKMLATRIQLLHKHLRDMENGSVPYDHSVTRQVASLIRRLPAAEAKRFNTQYLTEFNDTLLMAYLANITKSTNTINELVDLFDVLYDKQMRRAGRTAFV